LRYAE